jgi:hypothetical protein
MLAATGLLFPELFGTWNNAEGLFDASNPITAFASVPALGIAQIIGVIALIETRTGKGVDGGRVPGDIGFDPLGLSAEGISEKYALAELKNGRLAMIGVRAPAAESRARRAGRRRRRRSLPSDRPRSHPDPCAHPSRAARSPSLLADHGHARAVAPQRRGRD